MKVYAVYEITSGQLVSIGTVLADPLSSHLGVSVLSTPNGTIDPDLLTWDTQARKFVETPPPTPDPEVVATVALLDKPNRTRTEDGDLIQRLTALVPPEVWTG